MCLILFAYCHHPRYRLVLAANRDEFYQRPTQPLQFWQDQPQIAAGRDLKQMGTWLGITRQGRIAAITNYREPGTQKTDAPSRGDLVAGFLAGSVSPDHYLEHLRQQGPRYNGFNLIFGDTRRLIYFSNRGGSQELQLAPGIYGLSNRHLNTDWPKVRNGKTGMTEILKNHGEDIDRRMLCNLLQNQTRVPDDELPDTGVGLEWERILASIFITSPTYGTRSSSVITIDHLGAVEFSETTWQLAKAIPIEEGQKTLRFKIESRTGRYPLESP